MRTPNATDAMPSGADMSMPTDAGPDSSRPPVDTGLDAPSVLMDAALSGPDAAAPLVDAGMAVLDASPSPPPDGGQDYVSPWPDYQSEIYDNLALWNCHPARDDGPCAGNLDSTIVQPDGRLEVVPLVRVNDAPVDCFYVYPTCSMDDGVNADLEAGAEELFVTELQAARLGGHCRVFAPEYRQVSVSGLLNGPGRNAWNFAYADIEDAFKHYMTHYNGGRGVILIGHSQGGLMLRQLIREEIDNNEALRRQLVSAYILGAGVEVPDDALVGAAFEHVPVCTEADQFGCVVSYASYRSNEAFGPQHAFGRTNAPGQRLACVSPAQLAGEGPVLAGQFPTQYRSAVASFITGNTSPFAEAERVGEITTPFFSVPGLIEGECVYRDGHHFLSVTVRPDPEDPRADEIGGDMVIPGWGLHMLDVNLALDDINALVARQMAAYLRAQP